MTVLKILGIILLSIIGLLILLILFVLFVPLRYKVNATYSDAVHVRAKASYFLHILSFSYIYDGKTDIKFKLFGIPLHFKKKNKEDRADIDEKGNEGSNKDKKSSDVEVKDKEDNVKKNSRKRTIKDYISLLNEDTTKMAFQVCKRRLGKLLKHLIPRKMDIVVKYGLSNPYFTSVVMSVYDIFYIYLDRVITLYPVYDEEIIDCKAAIKGRITPAPIIWHLIMVILDKNCRMFIKKVR